MTRLNKIRSALGAAALVAISLQPGLSAAQNVPQSHLDAARDAVVAARALSAFDDILPNLAEQTRTIFIRNDPAATAVIEEVVNEVALKMVEKRQELNKAVFEVWARRLTEEDLREITAFYRSPVGKKLAEFGPELTALSLGAAKLWTDTMSELMIREVGAELRKRGVIE